MGNIIDGFSEILVCNSLDPNPTCSGENINDNYAGNLEDNYWNSLLNLVDASPTGSSVF
jgi:myb proto-oncogene protein